MFGFIEMGSDRLRAPFRVDAFNFTDGVLLPGPDKNPADEPPVGRGNGTYTGSGRDP